MLIDKRQVYLGATLFSTMILTAVSGQSVKAAATTTATTTQTSPSGSSTSKPETTRTDPIATSLSASPSAMTTGSSSTVKTTSVIAPTTIPIKATATVPTSKVAVVPIDTSSSDTTSATIKQPTSVAVKQPTPTTMATSTAPSSVTAATTSTSMSATASAVASPTTSATTTATIPTSNSSSGLSLPASSIPTQTPTDNTAAGTTTSTTPTDSYELPANLTDSSVVSFTDPVLGGMVKDALGIKAGSDVTVGDIRNYHLADSLTLNEWQTPSQKGLSEITMAPIESLNGIQYMRLLPKDMISFTARLGSDTKANPDLTPLNGIKFNGLELVGNFSNPNAKEISAEQITKLQVPSYGAVILYGDNNYNGINNSELKTLAPWLIDYTNNGQQYNAIMFNGNAISDYSPLKDVNRTADLNFNNNGGVYSSIPIYAVKGQPITFTSQPVTGIDGDDLAAGYHFSSTVPADKLANNNLINLGNDQYKLVGADPNAKVLTYGDAGFTYGYDPNAITLKYYNKSVFINITVHGQPLIWQDHPNVTIDYVDANGKPIMANGVAMTKIVNGVNIGDSFDLTADSTVAGYTLKGAAVGLKGAYTQDPQVITLTYTKDPIAKSSSSNHSSSSSTTGITVKPIKPITITPKSRELVKIHYINVTSTGKDALLADMGVEGTTMIKGKLYYLVGYKQFVLASDYNITKSSTPGVIRSLGFGYTGLVNAYGDSLGFGVSANSEWKYSRIVTIAGADYYEIAPDEYLPASSSIAFTPVAVKTNVNIVGKADLYDSQGKSLGATLPAGSDWFTDGCAIINGVKMYRVATDEWVSEMNANTYQPVSTICRATADTALYDASGRVLSRGLPAGTVWKVDRIITVDGQRYERVSTNEYVRVD